MKILDIAKECGAIEIKFGMQNDEATQYRFNQSQLTKFAELLSQQSEPYAWASSDGNHIEWRKGALSELSFKDDEILPMYLAPPQPQTVKDMLEKAAKICEEMVLYTGWDMAKEIRALIDQPQQPPASQKLLDYVDRLEKALNVVNNLDYTHEHKGISEIIKSALQSKPAKE